MSVIILVESNMERNIAIFRRETYSMVPDLLEDANSLSIKTSDDKFFRLETQISQCILEYSRVQARAANVNEYQLVLGMDNLRVKLWELLKEWRELQKNWLSSPFSQIEVRFISEKVDEFAKVVSRSENGLPDNPVSEFAVLEDTSYLLRLTAITGLFGFKLRIVLF